MPEPVEPKGNSLPQWGPESGAAPAPKPPATPTPAPPAAPRPMVPLEIIPSTSTLRRKRDMTGAAVAGLLMFKRQTLLQFFLGVIVVGGSALLALPVFLHVSNPLEHLFSGRRFDAQAMTEELAAAKKKELAASGRPAGHLRAIGSGLSAFLHLTQASGASPGYSLPPSPAQGRQETGGARSVGQTAGAGGGETDDAARGGHSEHLGGSGTASGGGGSGASGGAGLGGSFSAARSAEGGASAGSAGSGGGIPGLHLTGFSQGNGKLAIGEGGAAGPSTSLGVPGAPHARHSGGGEAALDKGSPNASISGSGRSQGAAGAGGLSKSSSDGTGSGGASGGSGGGAVGNGGAAVANQMQAIQKCQQAQQDAQPQRDQLNASLRQQGQQAKDNDCDNLCDGAWESWCDSNATSCGRYCHYCSCIHIKCAMMRTCQQMDAVTCRTLQACPTTAAQACPQSNCNQ